MLTRCKRIICATLLVLLAVYLGLSPRLSPQLYYSQLFRPDQGLGSQSDLRSFQEVENHEVLFKTADGAMLHGWIYLKPGSRKIYLVHPGNAGDIASRLFLTRLLLDSGGSVFQYDPRGFGMSAGKPSLQSISEDGVAAYDYLVKVRGYAPDSVVLYGMSLGSGVATYVSEKRKAGALVLHSPYYSLERIAKEKLPALRVYPSWLFPRPPLSNAAVLERRHPPVLILHGEKDQMIPIRHSEDLYGDAIQPKQFVRFPDSGHTSFDAGDIKAFERTMTDFLRNLP